MGESYWGGEFNVETVVIVTGFGGPTNRSLLFLKGNGNGTFATPTEQSYQFIEDTPVGSTRFSENTLSDLNGDGRPDIIVDHGGALNIVTVALSRGDGHFDLQELAASNGPGFLQDIHGNTPTADGNNTNATIVSDVNGDGIPDLVVACGGAGGGTRAGGVSILPGLGQGKFLAPRGYPIKNDLHFHSSFSYAGNSERSTALGDFNGDNKLDLITLVTGGEGDAVGGAGHLAEVLPGNGDGTFGSAIVALAGTSGLGTGANTIRVADMNHDGKLDVIVTSGPAGVQGNSGTTATRIAYGVGNGTFTYAVALPLGDINWSISNVIVADFNNDNVLDLAVLTQHGFNGGAQKRQEHIEVFTQSTTQPGTFTLTAGFPQTDIGDSNGEGMVAGDFDGDGKVDLVAGGTGAPSGPDQIMFLKGKGDGSFQTPVAAAGITLFNGRIFDARALDLNGDGKLDLIAAGFGGVSVYLGNGNGTFQPPVSYGSGGGGSTKMEVADLDFDGKPDLALGSDNGLTILRGGGGSTFGAPIFFGIGHLGVRSLRIGDLNGDGKLDLAVGHDIQSSENIFLAAVINNFPTVEFSLANYNINEGVGSAVITVVRTGDTTSTSTVDYTTSDTGAANPCGLVNGVASSRCDYITTLGTLIFAPKEVSKTLTVPIVDDLYVEGDEVFNLVLSNPANAVLGTHGSATGTIKDNDTVIPTTNPIDVASFFVRQHYIDFLNREPDQDGLNFWTNEITSCGTNAQCIEVKRINVSGAFFLSIEFQQTGYLVERLYKTGYGDATGSSTIGGAHQLGVPIVRFNEFLTDTQRVGQGVVVLQPGWEQVLENNKQALCAEFVQRQRFTDALPTTLTPAQFVDKLNQNAGNVLSTSERTAAINLFASAGDTANLTARAQVLRQVAEDQDLQNAEFNRAFVLMQYFGYLRRNPNDLPDTDYTGFDFWLTKLNQFNGNYQNAEMVKAFISSGEYRQRFGP